MELPVPRGIFLASCWYRSRRAAARSAAAACDPTPCVGGSCWGRDGHLCCCCCCRSICSGLVMARLASSCAAFGCCEHTRCYSAGTRWMGGWMTAYNVHTPCIRPVPMPRHTHALGGDEVSDAAPALGLRSLAGRWNCRIWRSRAPSDPAGSHSSGLSMCACRCSACWSACLPAVASDPHSNDPHLHKWPVGDAVPS